MPGTLTLCFYIIIIHLKFICRNVGGEYNIMPEKPNIFLIMTDQQKASATSIYGNKQVQTPTWERVAAQGAVFDNAYSASPICTPSRVTLMTGTYPPVHQVFCHQNHAPGNLKQLPEYLREMGYRCFAAGHYESERNLTKGWDEHVDMMETPELKHAVQELYKHGSRVCGWSSGTQDIAGEKAHAALLTDTAIDLIEKNAADDEPLFVHLAYIEPHPPYFAPSDFGNTVDFNDIPLPPRAEPGQAPAWHKQMLEDYKTADADVDDIKKLVAAYYGLISYVDHEIGRFLDYLDKKGLAENSWIILTSDHGDFTGEKGFFTKCETLYECLTHVPLVIRAPKQAKLAGFRTGELVELTDLFSTILGIGGCEIPEQAQGHDLKAWLEKGCREPLRETVFSAVGEYHGHLKTTMPWGLPYSGRHPGLVMAARSKQYSYIIDPDYGDEAYDLENDPNELHNLIDGNSELPQEARLLKQEIINWKKSCDELAQKLGVIPGKRNFDEKLNSEITGR